MRYRAYLLDVRQWMEEGNRESNGLLLTAASAKQALECICRERAEKVLRAKTTRGQALSLGAGLLLQYIWQKGDLEETDEKLVPLSISQVLEVLQGQPVEQLPIVYGSKGKPYFENRDTFFSLSHSGDYVLCAVSDEKIGADIQQCKDGLKESLVKRVLTDVELEEWNRLRSDEKQATLYFYQKWTEKEACSKLTGEGIFSELETQGSREGLICSDGDFFLPGYCVSVCQYSNIIRDKTFT